ncbi:MAG: VOC family protein [Sinobacteraceae bacterium]|nr:VOC family protein [Nevskiaceae bacterium]
MTSHTAKAIVCLWYEHAAEEAAHFYARTFPQSAVHRVQHAPADNPNGKEGDVLMVEFTALDLSCVGINGGPTFRHSEAFSIQVGTVEQAETDRYWNAIVGNVGQESHCGWCKDKWGISWQITPFALTEGVADPDPAVRKRVFGAMMDMKNIDVAAIMAARGLGPAHTPEDL